MENVIENNKLIVEFMGEEWIIEAIEQQKFNERAALEDDSNDIRFQSSWDWLMPVVNLCKERQLFGSQNLIDRIDNVLTCDCEIEKLYEVVVEFIKYYNENIK